MSVFHSVSPLCVWLFSLCAFLSLKHVCNLFGCLLCSLLMCLPLCGSLCSFVSLCCPCLCSLCLLCLSVFLNAFPCPSLSHPACFPGLFVLAASLHLLMNLFVLLQITSFVILQNSSTCCPGFLGHLCWSIVLWPPGVLNVACFSKFAYSLQSWPGQ